ncbi:MAG: hypothetical protein R3E68_06995 [Burkholderiaceae bacterium]
MTRALEALVHERGWAQPLQLLARRESLLQPGGGRSRVVQGRAPGRDDQAAPLKRAFAARAHSVINAGPR